MNGRTHAAFQGEARRTCVPYLRLYFDTVKRLHDLGREVHADRDLTLRIELVVYEAGNEVRLARAGGPQHHDCTHHTPTENSAAWPTRGHENTWKAI